MIGLGPASDPTDTLVEAFDFLDLPPSKILKRKLKIIIEIIEIMIMMLMTTMEMMTIMDTSILIMLTMSQLTKIEIAV